MDSANETRPSSSVVPVAAAAPPGRERPRPGELVSSCCRVRGVPASLGGLSSVSCAPERRRRPLSTQIAPSGRVRSSRTVAASDDRTKALLPSQASREQTTLSREGSPLPSVYVLLVRGQPFRPVSRRHKPERFFASPSGTFGAEGGPPGPPFLFPSLAAWARSSTIVRNITELGGRGRPGDLVAPCAALRGVRLRGDSRGVRVARRRDPRTLVVHR